MIVYRIDVATKYKQNIAMSFINKKKALLYIITFALSVTSHGSYSIRQSHSIDYNKLPEKAAGNLNNRTQSS